MVIQERETKENQSRYPADKRAILGVFNFRRFFCFFCTGVDANFTVAFGFGDAGPFSDPASPFCGLEQQGKLVPWVCRKPIANEMI